MRSPKKSKLTIFLAAFSAIALVHPHLNADPIPEGKHVIEDAEKINQRPQKPGRPRGGKQLAEGEPRPRDGTGPYFGLQDDPDAAMIYNMLSAPPTDDLLKAYHQAGANAKAEYYQAPYKIAVDPPEAYELARSPRQPADAAARVKIPEPDKTKLVAPEKCVELHVSDVDVFLDHVLPQIDQWINLRVLIIRDRPLTQEDIEKLGKLAAAPRLQQLSLYNIAGETKAIPKILEALPNLDGLTLQGNLTHAGMEGIGHLKKLHGLSVTTTVANRKPVITPDDIAQLKALEAIDINCADDEIVDTVTKITNLKILSFGGNFTEKSIPKIGNLKELRSLSLPGNTKDFQFLPDLKNLQFLSFGSNDPLTADQLNALGKCSALRFLRMHRTPLNDKDLAVLATLEKLEVLNIEWTGINGDGLPALAPCKSLRWISLDQRAALSQGGEKLQDLNEKVNFSFEHTLGGN